MIVHHYNGRRFFIFHHVAVLHFLLLSPFAICLITGDSNRQLEEKKVRKLQTLRKKHLYEFCNDLNDPCNIQRKGPHRINISNNVSKNEENTHPSVKKDRLYYQRGTNDCFYKKGIFLTIPCWGKTGDIALFIFATSVDQQYILFYELLFTFGSISFSLPNTR